jgi:glycosyltransferase involved in cell wall biosynthesis
VKVGLDATPLLGARTGVGRYVSGLLEGLADLDDGPDVVLTAFTWRGADALHGFRGPRVSTAGRRAPARLLQRLWRIGLPPVETLAGAVDVFHATNFVLPPLRRATGVVTVHDLAFLNHPETVAPASRRYRRLVPDGIRRAAVVCTPTRAVADELAARYLVPEAKLVVTPNGLGRLWLSGPEPATPDWLRGRGLPPSYVLFVGTDEPRKNLPLLVAAHAGLPDAPPLLLVGPSGWGRQTEEGRRVRRAGYLDEADLAGVVAAASVLVLPSRDEGFGITALEALACGVPVVAADLPALREVLGEQAIFFGGEDPEALAGAIAQALLPDPPGRAGSRREWAAKYTWRRTAEAAVRAYSIAAQG